MIKESILFVVSTGLLIYFVTPSDESAQADAVPEETQKPVIQAAESADDGWGYDDEDGEDDETFVFGEPLTNLDEDYDDKSSDDEERNSDDRPEQTETKKSRPTPSPVSRERVSGNSPQPNEPGGVDNPIIFETKTSSNPVDN